MYVCLWSLWFPLQISSGASYGVKLVRLRYLVKAGKSQKQYSYPTQYLFGYFFGCWSECLLIFLGSGRWFRNRHFLDFNDAVSVTK